MATVATIHDFGSVYVDDQLENLRFIYGGGVLSLGDTVPGKELSWVEYGKAFVADGSICNNISWAQLHRQGLIFGKPVRIDGRDYLCRCLKVGQKKHVPNEWDEIMDTVGEGDSTWNWSEGKFWGQELANNPGSAIFRSLRGGKSARNWVSLPKDYAFLDVGWRPILEPIVLPTGSCDRLVGMQVLVQGEDTVSVVRGTLKSCTDYDLVLEGTLDSLDVFPWAVAEGSQIIVDRAQALWLKEE